MKLVIVIDAPEQEIRDAIAGIPQYFMRPGPAGSPIQLIARALKQSYEEQKTKKGIVQ